MEETKTKEDTNPKLKTAKKKSTKKHNKKSTSKKKATKKSTAKKKSAKKGVVKKKPVVKKPAIKTIGIVGAGQMGKGIAQVSAQTGFNVIVVEPYGKTIEKAKHSISTSLDRAVELGRINQKKKDKILTLLTFSKELKSLKKADIIKEKRTWGLYSAIIHRYL